VLLHVVEVVVIFEFASGVCEFIYAYSEGEKNILCMISGGVDLSCLYMLRGRRSDCCT
jgi:hypothetical protein